MTGKEKCEFLRGLREKIAKENGLVYPFKKCTHQGECTGTCPQCDKEIEWLYNMLNKINHAVITEDNCDQFVDHIDSTITKDSYYEEHRTPGVITSEYNLLLNTSNNHTSDDTVVCPVCGTVVSKKDKYCVCCGSVINSEEEQSSNHKIICSKCGYENKEDYKFCYKCGTKLQDRISRTHFKLFN